MNWFFRQHTKEHSVGLPTPSDASALPSVFWSSDAGSEAVYQDRRYSTLRIIDDGVREASVIDLHLGPPVERVVRALHDFEAWRALPVFLLAGLCLTTLDATAKYLVLDHSLFLVVWARYAGQMLIVAPFAWQRSGRGFWRTRQVGLQLLRSTMLLGATVCFFAGLRFLPLAEGSAILFLAPILIVVLSGPLLGERPTRARWVAAIAGFAGVLILLRPGSAVFHPATLLLLGAAVCNAFYHMLTRRLSDDDVYTTLFYSALVGATGLTLALPWGFESASLSWREGVLLLALGLFAGVAHWLLTRAFLLAPASLLTPFTYLQMLWATLFGYVVFGQLPDGWSAVGMAIILGSGVALALLERRRARIARSFP